MNAARQIQNLTPPRALLEIAIDNLADAIAAIEAGADRLEICSSLSGGGVTPSLGFARATATLSNTPVVVLVRARPGDFVYSSDVVELMREDCKEISATEVDAIAIGALKSDGDIDLDATRALCESCGDKAVVFHRAFDLTRDPFQAMEQLIDLGLRRILTSGQAASAVGPNGGASLIAELVQRAAGRIEILPAGGIRASNAREILSIPGVTQIHSSCRRAHTASRDARLMRLGFANDSETMLDPSEVEALHLICKEFPPRRR